MKLAYYGRIFAVTFLSVFLAAGAGYAGKTAEEIDAKVDKALERFEKEVYGAKNMLKDAKGVLVFPEVIKAGFILGGQVQRVYLLFMNDDALADFRLSDGWQAGVDGSIVLIKVGADGSIDTTKTNEPVLAFVLGQKGLMGNLNIEGSKYNRIKPE